MHLFLRKTKYHEKADVLDNSFEIIGRLGWKVKYLKEVDNEEITLKFWQEVYDETDTLREIHEKYPIDKGHKKI